MAQDARLHSAPLCLFYLAIKLKNSVRIKHSLTFINYQLLFHTFGVFTSDKKRSVHLQFYSLDRGLNIYVLFHNFIIQESSL